MHLALACRKRRPSGGAFFRLSILMAVGVGIAMALLRSAPVQGVSRPPHAASRDCRTAHPLPVRTRVRLHRNAETHGKREASGPKVGKTMHPRRERQPAFVVPAPTRSAAGRAGMAGWAGEGGGRFGERREYEAPTLPSTPRQHGAARHHTCQPRNSTPPKTPNTDPLKARPTNPISIGYE